MGQGEKLLHISGARVLPPVLHQIAQHMGLSRRQIQLLQGFPQALAG